MSKYSLPEKIFGFRSSDPYWKFDEKAVEHKEHPTKPEDKYCSQCGIKLPEKIYYEGFSETMYYNFPLFTTHNPDQWHILVGFGLSELGTDELQNYLDKLKRIENHMESLGIKGKCGLIIKPYDFMNI